MTKKKKKKKGKTASASRPDHGGAAADRTPTPRGGAGHPRRARVRRAHDHGDLAGLGGQPRAGLLLLRRQGGAAHGPDREAVLNPGSAWSKRYAPAAGRRTRGALSRLAAARFRRRPHQPHALRTAAARPSRAEVRARFAGEYRAYREVDGACLSGVRRSHGKGHRRDGRGQHRGRRGPRHPAGARPRGFDHERAWRMWRKVVGAYLRAARRRRPPAARRRRERACPPIHDSGRLAREMDSWA